MRLAGSAEIYRRCILVNFPILSMTKQPTLAMATYNSQVSESHKRYRNAAKRASSGRTLMKAFRAHERAHRRLLKKHLREELMAVKRKAKKLDRK